MNNQLTKWLGAVSLALSAQAVSADMLGLHLGVGVWQNESDGDLLSLAVPQDTSDLGMDDDNANF
ncbi:MAG: hypothetical protein OEZ23_02200, partial [Gammaproteobacteria bacterium]|nr:hypothetical protein [Gammaproteobacteria bacterium]